MRAINCLDDTQDCRDAELQWREFALMIASQVYGEKSVQLKRFSSASNIVFGMKFGSQTKIVKFIQSQNMQSIDKEICIHKLLKQYDIPCVEIEKYDDSRSLVPYPWYTMSESGKSLHQIYWARSYRLLRKRQLRQLFVQAGRTFAKIHAIQVSPSAIGEKANTADLQGALEVNFNKCMAILSQQNRLEGIDIHKLEQIIADLRNSDLLSLCHLDYGPHQLLIKNKKISSVIDWEGAHIFSSWYDLAKCELKFKLRYKKLFDDFCLGYQQICPIPDDYEHFKKPYQVIEVLVMLKSLVSERSPLYLQYRQKLDELMLEA